MKVEELAERTIEVASVRRVFGDPIDKDGVTIIPVAQVIGGGGGGSAGLDLAPGEAVGDDTAGVPKGEGEAGGGGFGIVARPIGVYVVRDGDVTWKPAINPMPIVIGAQVCFVVAALVIGRAIRRRR